MLPTVPKCFRHYLLAQNNKGTNNCSKHKFALIKVCILSKFKSSIWFRPQSVNLIQNTLLNPEVNSNVFWDFYIYKSDDKSLMKHQ